MKLYNVCFLYPLVIKLIRIRTFILVIAHREEKEGMMSQPGLWRHCGQAAALVFM